MQVHSFVPETEGKLPHITAFTGGGGKSTLMYCLAERLAGQGKKVLVTTSTHIYFPHRCVYAASEAEARRLWREKHFAVIGTETGSGKLTQPDQKLLEALLTDADAVLVEADGSKGFPVKFPRDGEPVIWPGTGLVVCVLGLSAMGKPVQECCFGRIPPGNDIFTEEKAVQLLSWDQGGRKGVEGRSFWVVLNQCDDDRRLQSARRIAAGLKTRGVETVFAVSLAEKARSYYSRLANAEA